MQTYRAPEATSGAQYTIFKISESERMPEERCAGTVFFCGTSGLYLLVRETGNGAEREQGRHAAEGRTGRESNPRPLPGL